MTKTEAYTDLFKLFNKMTDVREQRNAKRSSQAIKNLGLQMSLIGMNIALLGSDQVVNDYINWRAAALTGKTEKVLKAFSRLMLSMREDLDPHTKITNYETMLDTFIEVV